MFNTNSFRDETNFQDQPRSNLTFSQKTEYYWQKYKLHIIVVLFLACLFGSLLHPVIHQKETILSIAYINAFPNVADEIIINDFETYLQLNCEKQQVLLDTTYYIDNNSSSPYARNYSQSFSTKANSGKFDVVLADSDNFDVFGNQGFFQNLSNVLSEKELQQYKDRLYYIDFPDDDSDKKIPIGIKINKSSQICKTSCYPNMDAYFGIMAGTKRVDYALSYLNYLEH